MFAASSFHHRWFNMPQIFCPTCESILEVDDASLGAMVECGACKAQFTAKLPPEATPPKATDNGDAWKPRKSSRRSKFDDNDDPLDDPLSENYERKKTPPGKGLALTSLILGIVGLVLALISCIAPCCFVIFIIVDILAIIFGAITLKSEYRNMAMPGMLMGIGAIVLSIILIVLRLVLQVGLMR